MEYKRLLMNLILIVVVYFLFGQVNVDRFLQGGISVTKFKETSLKIPSPVLFIANASSYKVDGQPLCDGNGTVEDFAKCVEENTREFISFIHCDKPHHKINRVYLRDVCSVIHPFDGSIGLNETTAMKLTLKANSSYTITVMDKSFAFLSSNPSLTPRSAITVKDTDNHIIVFLKAVKMMKLNTDGSPCEPSPDYVFDSCVKDNIAKEVGCKPFWISRNISALGNCTQRSELTRFLRRVRWSAGMDDKTLFDSFGCLMPCSYIDYKLAEAPIRGSLDNYNGTIVSIRFDSPTITTEQEEMAYRLVSLIADTGGLLGLFVGFNFMMFWDCVSLVLKFLKSKTVKNNEKSGTASQQL